MRQSQTAAPSETPNSSIEITIGIDLGDRWGLELAVRAGKNAKKRAVVAVALKLAVLLHRLWVTSEVYEPLYGIEPQTA
jgi:hypothetical protein